MTGYWRRCGRGTPKPREPGPTSTSWARVTWPGSEAGAGRGGSRAITGWNEAGAHADDRRAGWRPAARRVLRIRDGAAVPARVRRRSPKLGAAGPVLLSLLPVHHLRGTRVPALRRPGGPGGLLPAASGGRC